MIKNELLDILCCPESKQSLTQASSELLDKINKDIRDGRIKNRSGIIVKEEIQGLLLREDKKFGYPIREEIPIMLINEALDLDN